MTATTISKRQWNAAMLGLVLIGVTIATYLIANRDFEVRRYAGWIAPMFAWIVVSEDMRKHFRSAWFWWVSIIFVALSAEVVSLVNLAHFGALVWLFIAMIEAGVFVVLVDFAKSRWSD